MLTGTVSVYKDEKVVKIDGDDGVTKMWRYQMSLNCTLKNG